MLCERLDMLYRVRRPRLPDRFGPGRVPRLRHRVRHTAPRRPSRRLPAATSRSSPRGQGADRRARREHLPRRRRRHHRSRQLPTSSSALTPGGVRSRRGDRAARGIILAIIKFEFGRRGAGGARDANGGSGAGTIVLADEVLTPDSSRFWPADLYEPGHAQPSYDKQYVRDWLTSPASGWQKSLGHATTAAARRRRRQDAGEVHRGVRARQTGGWT